MKGLWNCELQQSIKCDWVLQLGTIHLICSFIVTITIRLQPDHQSVVKHKRVET